MPIEDTPKIQNYKVKNIESVIIGSDVQSRVFTLAPADVIPWHHHSECTDYYFVLKGVLTIETRNPETFHSLRIGDRHQIKPGTSHLLANKGAEDCDFLLVQGLGKYDWIKS